VLTVRALNRSITGRPVWRWSISPTRLLHAGTPINSRRCWIWVWTASKLILASVSRSMSSITMVLTHRPCTTSTPIFTTRLFMNYWRRNAGWARQCSLRAAPLLVLRSSRSIGVATVRLVMLRWQRAYGPGFHSCSPVFHSGVMTSVALR